MNIKTKEKTTIYDPFIEGLLLVRHHENFYLQSEHDLIFIGVTEEDYPEDSEIAKKLTEKGFFLDEGTWAWHT